MGAPPRAATDEEELTVSTPDPGPWASPGPRRTDPGPTDRWRAPDPEESVARRRGAGGAEPAQDPWVATWAVGAPAGGSPDGSEQPPRRPRRRWPVVVVVTVAVLVLVACLVALVVSGVRSGWDALSGGGSDLFGVEPGETYGDNPVLDEMWDGCEAGDGDACDDLYDSSGVDTDYEDFGWTCGERFSDGPGSGWCVDEMGDLADVREGSRYGDDAVLDRLWDGCEGGDGVDCDELYASAESGSDYEKFGLTCGERYSELRAPDFCAEALR